MNVKKVFVVAIFVLGIFVVVSLISSCGQGTPKSIQSSQALAGEHDLLMINKSISSSSSFSAWFVFAIGHASGNSKSEDLVSFYWQSNGGEYVYTTLPLKIVRIKFDEKTDGPKVIFTANDNWRWPSDPNVIDDVLYATFIVKKSDWPISGR